MLARALPALSLLLAACSFDRSGLPALDGPADTAADQPIVAVDLGDLHGEPPLPDLGPVPWFDSNWHHRKEIRISAAITTSTLSDFPLLIALGPDTDLAAGAKKHGEDLIFVLPGASQKLPHEIERYHGGELLAWVRLPALEAATDTTLHLYYGREGPDQQDPQGVWSGGYEAVWHMAQAPGSILDATGRHPGACRGEMDKKDLVQGRIGHGLDFDGVDDAVDVSTLDVVASGAGNNGLTLEGWVHSRSGHGRLISKATDVSLDSHFWMLALSAGPDDRLDFRLRTNVPTVWHWATGVTTSAWMHVAATYDGAQMRIYRDGVEVLCEAHGGPIASDGKVTTSIGNNPKGPRPLDGILDEVRVSTVARSGDWLAAQVKNQSDPSSWITVGLQETQP